MSNKIRKIGIVTGTRAEYSFLEPLIESVYNSSDMSLLLYVTGLHLTKHHDSAKQIHFPISASIQMISNEKESTTSSLAISLSDGIRGFVEAFSRDMPDVVIILGDRVEPFAAAIAAAFLNIPVVHLQGGDVTYSMLDDSIRHSITKLAHLHFPATRTAYNRILQMGEEKWRVKLVGSLALDKASKIKEGNFHHVSGITLPKNPCLVIFHPETLSSDNGNIFGIILDSLLDIGIVPIVIYPNLDPGSPQIIDKIDEYSANRRIIAIKNLEHEKFLGLAKRCGIYIGNSSSGLIELPFIGVKCINVGHRQDGRDMPSSVINVANPTTASIKAALRKALSVKYKTSKSPYWQGGAVKRIMPILRKYLGHKKKLLLKKFVMQKYSSR